ncbi:MAG: zinc ribbon domain-containing protein, partial [Dermatophilaceae bacterium]
TARFGWLAPLIAASVIGGVAWLLLSQESRHRDEDTPTAALSSCPECGRVVLSQWRMCPYCGDMLETTGPARPAASDS